MLNRALLLVGLVGVAGSASAQKLIFNFERINDNHKPIHTSAGGYALLETWTLDQYGAPIYSYKAWFKDGSIRQLENLGNTKLLKKIANDGSVYGIDGNTLVKWDSTGKKSAIRTLASNYELVDLTPSGKLMLAEVFPTTNQYGGSWTESTVYEYNSSSNSMPEIIARSRFVPKRYGPNGMLIGNNENFAYQGLYDAGTITTYNPYATYGNAGGSGAQNNLFVLQDGSSLVRRESGYSIGSYSVWTDFITHKSASGEELDTAAQGYVPTPYWFHTYASGGLAFGYVGNFKPYYRVGTQSYEINADNYEPGSLRVLEFLPDQFADSGYLIAKVREPGPEKYMIGTYRFEGVPEPVTLAALGLGSLALLRKRRRKA